MSNLEIASDAIALRWLILLVFVGIGIFSNQRLVEG